MFTDSEGRPNSREVLVFTSVNTSVELIIEIISISPFLVLKFLAKIV